MASGIEVLQKFKKLFDKLGTPEGSIKLVPTTRPATDAGPADLSDPISLGRALLNDADGRIQLGITDIDTQVVRFWGGQIGSGIYEAVRDALIRARLTGLGGVLIYGEPYELQSFPAGFAVDGQVTQWFLTCTGKRQ